MRLKFVSHVRFIGTVPTRGRAERWQRLCPRSPKCSQLAPPRAHWPSPALKCVVLVLRVEAGLAPWFFHSQRREKGSEGDSPSRMGLRR